MLNVLVERVLGDVDEVIAAVAFTAASIMRCIDGRGTG
jgi:hypothetical protein